MAADAAGDLGLLAANARRSIRDLRRAVSGAKAQDARRRGTRFLELIDAALTALDERVAGAETMAGVALDEADRRAAVRYARRINYDVRLLHEAAPWVESARQGALGLGLVYFVDEMVAALRKEPADVVMAPTATYMYSTVYDIPKWLQGALHVPVPDGPTAMVVAYPVHEPDSLFLHLIIAHELGHSVVPSQRLTDKVRTKDLDEAVTKAALATAAEQYLATHDGTSREARGRVETMLEDWLTELLCDALGIAFLGPSFLFTFVAFSTPFEQDAAESHPPFALRTDALISHIEEAGWADAARAVAPKTFAWITEPGPSPSDPTRPYFGELEKAARHLSPIVTKVARDHVGDELFRPDPHEVDELMILLRHDVLPAQTNAGAAARRSIVLAGWMHAFEEHDDDPASLANIIGDRDRQRFLTKALEMSKVLETWGTLP